MSEPGGISPVHARTDSQNPESVVETPRRTARVLVTCNDVPMTESDRINAELWRLGLLLTGEARGADRALRRVLEAHPSVLKLTADRRLRLLVQGARDAEPSPGESAGSGLRAESLHATIAALEPLPRICWTLRDIAGMSEVEAANAVGLSRSACERYADEARGRVAAALGERLGESIEALRLAATIADPTPSLAEIDRSLAGVRARRRLVATAQILALLGVLALLAWVGSDLIRTHESELEEIKMVEELSAPMSKEDAARREELRRQGQDTPAGRELPRGPAR